MAKYINMFLSMAPDQVSKIKAGAEAKDWQAVRATAHSFKAQINYMGIASLKDVIVDIQDNAGAEKNLEQMPDLVSKLDTDISQAIEELKIALTNLG